MKGQTSLGLYQRTDPARIGFWFCSTGKFCWWLIQLILEQCVFQSSDILKCGLWICNNSILWGIPSEAKVRQYTVTTAADLSRCHQECYLVSPASLYENWEEVTLLATKTLDRPCSVSCHVILFLLREFHTCTTHFGHFYPFTIPHNSSWAHPHDSRPTSCLFFFEVHLVQLV